jgi:hypothetical protein
MSLKPQAFFEGAKTPVGHTVAQKAELIFHGACILLSYKIGTTETAVKGAMKVYQDMCDAITKETLK